MKFIFRLTAVLSLLALVFLIRRQSVQIANLPSSKDNGKEQSLQVRHVSDIHSGSDGEKTSRLALDGAKNISNSIELRKVAASMHFKLNAQAFIPMVIFCSYRPEYTSKLVHSLQNIQLLNPQTPCLFVLHKGPKISNDNVRRMNALLKQIDCCKVIKWEVNDSNKNRTSKTLKRHWYKVVTKVFEDPDIFDLKKVYQEDVIFLEDDIILSPDAIKVIAYGIHVKKSRQRIVGVGLGGWSGENLINAHPDTFDVRYTAFFPSMAYAFNASFWQEIKTSKFMLIRNNDWSESLGLIINRFMKPRPLFILPTLGRMWHVGKSGLGLRGDGSMKRHIQIGAHWLKSPRLINLETASVNSGVRDIFGFLCKESELRNFFTMRCICPQSYNRFPPNRRFEIVCHHISDNIRDPCLKKFPFLYRDDSEWS